MILPALKNFGITFLISALIFSIVAYFLFGFLTSTVNGILDEENEILDSLFTEVPDVTTDVSNKDTETLPEIRGDSFTVLFALTDKREDVFDYFPEEEKEIDKIETNADKSFGLLTKDYHIVKTKSIILVRISKESREYSIIPIPSISKVYTQMGAGYTLLEDVMYFYDKEYFVQKIAAMTGITPDYSFIVNVTDMDDVLKSIGGFTCNIPEDIYTDGKKFFPEPPKESSVADTSVAETESPENNETTAVTTEKEEKIVIEKVVSQGKVTVGASNIEAILLFENYSDGIAEHAQLHANFIKGLIGKLSKSDDAALKRIFNDLTKKEKIETDMTETQFLSKGELIRAFEDFDVTVYEYPGAMSSDFFAPNIMDAAKQFLGLRLPPDPTKAS